MSLLRPIRHEVNTNTGEWLKCAGIYSQGLEVEAANEWIFTAERGLC